MKLRISDDLALPIDAITHKFAVLGTSGSGKSYTAMKLAELMLDHDAQIIGVDPVGIWWSLRLAADGKSDGYKQVVVFGGEHGDLPLTPESGSLVARMLAERRIPAVLDVSQFITSEQIRFLAAFGEQFFESKKTHKSPVHLFLEECQTVVPEEPQRDENVMLNRWRRLIKFGRNYGVGVSLISQQPQAVDKKVLNECPTLIAMRTVGGHQRKAILSWVKDVIESESDLVANLPKLATGVAHVWSPEWLKISTDVKIAKKTTFDAGKTPEIGTHAVEPRPLTPIDVEKFKSSMSEMIEKAKQEDPKELRKKIGELERHVRDLETHPQMKVETVTMPVIPEIVFEYLKDFQRDIDRLTGASEAILGDLKAVGQQAGIAVGRIQKESELKPSHLFPVRVDPKMPRGQIDIEDSRGRRPLIKNIGSSNGDGSLPKGERIVLTAIAQFQGGVERDQLSVLTGYKRSSRDAYVSRLKEKGMVADDSGKIVATIAGVSALGSDYEPLPTGRDLYDHWMTRLPEGERKILEVLYRHHGKGVDRDALDDQTGYKRSSRDAYISRLAARRLVEIPQAGMVAASSNLF